MGRVLAGQPPQHILHRVGGVLEPVSKQVNSWTSQPEAERPHPDHSTFEGAAHPPARPPPPASALCQHPQVADITHLGRGLDRVDSQARGARRPAQRLADGGKALLAKGRRQVAPHLRAHPPAGRDERRHAEHAAPNSVVWAALPHPRPWARVAPAAPVERSKPPERGRRLLANTVHPSSPLGDRAKLRSEAHRSNTHLIVPHDVGPEQHGPAPTGVV